MFYSTLRTVEEIRESLMFCNSLPAEGDSAMFYYRRDTGQWCKYENGEWNCNINSAFVFAEYDMTYEQNPYNIINTTSHDHNP